MRSSVRHSLVLICLLLAAPAQADTGLLDFIAAETSHALGTSVDVLPKRALPVLSISDGAELALRFPSGTGQHLPSGLEVRADGRLLRSIALASYLDFRLRVATLPQGLTRCASLGTGSIGSELLTLAPGQEIVTDGSAVLGMMPRGQIAAGERLRLSRLVPAPLVRRGAAVPLLLRGGGVQLSATGEALADGYAGQALSVRRASDGHVWRGVVEHGDSGIVVVVE